MDIKDEIKQVSEELFKVQKELTRISKLKTFQRFGKDAREAIKSTEDLYQNTSALLHRLQGREKVLADMMEEANKAREKAINQAKKQAAASAKVTKNYSTQAKEVSKITKETSKRAKEIDRINTALLKQAKNQEKANKETKKGLIDANKLSQKLNQVDKKSKADTVGILNSQKAGLRDAFSSLRFFAEQQLKWYATKAVTLKILAIPSDVIQSVKEYNQGLIDIASVTRATNASVAKLGKTIIKVATSTKFSIADIAGAGKLLAQAGLSLAEVNATLMPIAQIATATSSTIEDSADVMITALRAYKKSMTETNAIADTFINVSNNSKVTIHGLGVAFNYLAGTTAILGISLKQTSALIGILANSGLKLSTAATGLRTALLSLEAPTPKMTKILARYKISVDAVNPSLHKMTDILKTLSVISKTDLIKAFSIRSANAILALENAGTDAIDELRNSLDASGTASLEAKEQLLGLANAWDNFKQTVSSTEALIGKVQTNATVDLLKGFQIRLQESNKSLQKNTQSTHSWVSSIIELGATATIMSGVLKKLTLVKKVGTDLAGNAIYANGFKRYITLGYKAAASFGKYAKTVLAAGSATEMLSTAVAGVASLITPIGLGIAAVTTIVGGLTYAVVHSYLQIKENIGKFYNDIVRVESALKKGQTAIHKVSISLKTYTAQVKAAYGANSKLTSELIKQRKLLALNDLHNQLASSFKEISISNTVATQIAKNLGLVDSKFKGIVTSATLFNRIISASGTDVNKLSKSYKEMFTTVNKDAKAQMKQLVDLHDRANLFAGFSGNTYGMKFSTEKKVLDFMNELNKATSEAEIEDLVNKNEDLVKSLAQLKGPLRSELSLLIAIKESIVKVNKELDTFKENSNKLIDIAKNANNIKGAIAAQSYLTDSQVTAYVRQINDLANKLTALKKVNTGAFNSKELTIYKEELKAAAVNLDSVMSKLQSASTVNDTIISKVDKLVQKVAKGAESVKGYTNFINLLGNQFKKVANESYTAFARNNNIAFTTKGLEELNKRLQKLNLTTANTTKATKQQREEYTLLEQIIAALVNKNNLLIKSHKDLISLVKQAEAAFSGLSNKELDNYQFLSTHKDMWQQLGISDDFKARFGEATAAIVANWKTISKAIPQKTAVVKSISQVLEILEATKHKTKDLIKVISQLKDYKAKLTIKTNIDAVKSQLEALRKQEALAEAKSKLGLPNNLNRIVTQEANLKRIAPENIALTNRTIQLSVKGTEAQKAEAAYYAEVTKINKSIIHNEKLKDELLNAAHQKYLDTKVKLEQKATLKQLDISKQNLTNQMAAENLLTDNAMLNAKKRIQILELEKQKAIITAKQKGLNVAAVEQEYNNKIKIAQLKTSQDVAAGYTLAFIELQKTTKTKAEYIADVMKVSAQAMTTSFSNFFFDAMQGKLKSFGDYFKSFAATIEQTVAQITAKLLVLKIMETAVAGFASGGAFVDGKQVYGQGGAFIKGVQAFAAGGIVNKPTVFPMANGLGLMGEAGAEAVMPLTRTKNGDLGVKAEDQPKQQQITINNVVDPALFGEYISSPTGNDMILNIISKNNYKVRKVLGG